MDDHKSLYSVTSSISPFEDDNESIKSEKIITGNNINEQTPTKTSNIVMNGKMLYRHTIDQYELEGSWGMESETQSESFCYLFNKPNKQLVFPVNKLDIQFNSQQEMGKYDNNVPLNISSCNLHEVILIPHEYIFKSVLQYLSGDYHGYFVYFCKTIEDKFTLDFELENRLVKVSGHGTNNLGNFNVLGYINFYTSKGK